MAALMLRKRLSICGNSPKLTFFGLRGTTTETAKSTLEENVKKYGVQGTSYMFPWKGVPADKKPVKYKLEAGKSYEWCGCGHSRRQPFCDHSHDRQGFDLGLPVTYIPKKDETVLLCNCKLTNKRPFCDGSHKQLPAGPLDPTRQKLYYYAGDSPVSKGVAAKLGFKEDRGEIS